MSRFITRVVVIGAIIVGAALVAIVVPRILITNHASQVATADSALIYTAKADRLTSAPHTDGALVFRLAVVRCSTVTNTGGNSYCVIAFDMENISSKPVVFDTVYQAAYDTAGKRYSPAPLSRAGITPDSDTYLVVPGGIATAALWFLMPSDAELATVELHESALSSGVRISVST